MRILMAAIAASAGLFFLAVAIVALADFQAEWPVLVGRLLASIMMALVGVASIRVAGYLLQPNDQKPGSEFPENNS
jgi:hypothetical protein